jgi:DNA-binding NarL/FixJ family response regulator
MPGIESIIWLVDGHEIRRVAIAGVLAPLAEKASAKVLAIDCPKGIAPAMPSEQLQEMCILVTGGTSLADHGLRGRVNELRSILAGRPLAIFSDLDTDEEVSLAIDLGAHGFVSSSSKGLFAIAAFEFILSGGTYFKQSALANLSRRAFVTHANVQSKSPTHIYAQMGPSAHEMSKVTQARFAGLGNETVTDLVPLGDVTRHPSLTHRQNDIVNMLKLGKSNKEIARLLEISDATVKIFVRQVMKKFGAINRTQVALLASDAMSPTDMRNGQVVYSAGLRTN